MPALSRASRLLVLTGLTVLLLGAVFFLPYEVPVVPSVSLSYITGFNNRVAVVAFVLFGSIFTWFARELLPPAEDHNQPLPLWTLPVAIIAMLVLALLRLRHHWPVLGSEAFYAVERQLHLDRGEHLYRDFEYIYGPLLLYPGHFLKESLRLSTLAGYLTALVAFYGAGGAMIWFTVAKLNLSKVHRKAVLAFLFASSALTLTAEGTNASPFRLYMAASLSLWTYLVWRRSGKPYLTAGCAILAISLGLLVSPEQGLGLGVGLSAYGLVLAWADRRAFPFAAACLIPLATAILFLAASHAGMLLSLRSLAQGGLNFPLLPSGPNLFFLATYLCGLGALVSALRQRKVQSPVLPLGLCGTAMLTSAFGRCDQGHLASAIPLYLLSIFTIASQRRLFWLWLSLAVYFVFPFRYLWYAGQQSMRAGEHSLETTAKAPSMVGPPAQPIAQKVYFAPIGIPMTPQGALRWPVESGFYFGLWNVTTPAAIQAKADEIASKRMPFLLLPDSDGAISLHFWSSEEDVNQLHFLEDAPWVPDGKRALPSTAPIRHAIMQLYRPTTQAQLGWRVWAMR